MICATIGTAFELDDQGIILFIEDVNEPLYRVDRLLTHLRQAGKLGQVRGVLVGDFAGVDVSRLELLLKQELGPLNIPVLSGWRSGHCDPNITLPMGAHVRLDADKQQLVLEQAVVSGYAAGCSSNAGCCPLSMRSKEDSVGGCLAPSWSASAPPCS